MKNEIGRPFKPGNPGRQKGSKNKPVPWLDDAIALYHKKGGLPWLEKWVDTSPLNLRKFMETLLLIAAKQVAEKREHSGEVSAVLKFDFGENGNGKEGHE